MYLGIDIGGSKTLVALLSDDGQIQNSQKFPTPPDYQQFLQQLSQTVRGLNAETVKSACVAVPGVLDETNSIAVSFGNLPWTNAPIKTDCQRLLACPVMLENDAKLAGLSEANLIISEFKKVLFVTISTGIGYSLIIDGMIDQDIADGGGHTLLLEHDGKLVPWESFASGKAIIERYGKLASELEDPVAWQAISEDLAVGLIDLIAMLQPEVIVFGGGVGAHFEKFEQPLTAALKALESPMAPIPPLRQAKHAEEAVIYGCYDLLRTGRATA